MILNGALAPNKTGEREMLLSLLDVLETIKNKYLIILDRGYPGFDIAYEFKKRNIDFVIRLSSNFNKEVEAFINNSEVDTTITVRLVKVILDNGDVEILMTSLTDNVEYPVSIFKELYFMRWGIETLYDKVKNKLKVEEFTGYSDISILQDFYCTLFLSNIQSLLVSEANEELIKQNINDKKYEYKVNTNLSIGFIKERIVELFLKENNAEDILTYIAA